jgi:hypothetical protein
MGARRRKKDFRDAERLLEQRVALPGERAIADSVTRGHSIGDVAQFVANHTRFIERYRGSH